MGLGDRIKELRKSEELTQKEFSKRLLISQSYLSGLENGNETPTEKLIKLICLEFGVDREWLVSGSGEMYTEVYEHDKSALADISNSALLKIMVLLSTKSNVEYGIYAYSLELFVDAMRYSDMWDEDKKLEYLTLLETFVLDFDRMIYLIFQNREHFERHIGEVSRDLQRFTEFLQKNNYKGENV